MLSQVIDTVNGSIFWIRPPPSAVRYEGIFVYRESRSSEIRSERRVLDKFLRKEVPIMEKRQLTEEIEVLIRQLVMQNQMVMASQVLIAYINRTWKVDQDQAKYFMIKYFEKFYSNEVKIFQQRLAKRLKKEEQHEVLS